MNEFMPPAKAPVREPKAAKLLRYLQRRWMTAADSMELCGLLSLSQQITRWERAEGLRFERKPMEANGSRFLAYRLAK